MHLGNDSCIGNFELLNLYQVSPICDFKHMSSSDLMPVHSAINFLKNVPYLMPVVLSNNFGTNQSGFIWESF